MAKCKCLENKVAHILLEHRRSYFFGPYTSTRIIGIYTSLSEARGYLSKEDKGFRRYGSKTSRTITSVSFNHDPK